MNQVQEDVFILAFR